ncbi:MAG: exonuclease SbcCD subunit D [Clostridiales bacterium]|nr:exonuclease SbcCD subunit D [Clostridiales bacterium]
MRFIHLSDLHIGKRVNGFSMLEDQEYILIKILNVIDETGAEGVILAGDIYDKTTPPAEAVMVLDGFLNSLVKRGLPVFIISGNHDSPERLAFASRLISKTGVYISPVFDGKVESAALEDEYGKINIYLLPFIRPANVSKYLGTNPGSYTEAVEDVIKTLGINKEERNILVTHQFVTGAERSDSEDISVGGADNVSAEAFADFDYTALGHIHKPQSVRANIRYCGTPLKYSFSEAKDVKSVTVVDLKEKGNIEIQIVPLIPKRDMRKLRGSYSELTLKANYENTNREDYLGITLTDTEYIPDAIGKLRTVYPNIMTLDYEMTAGKTFDFKERGETEERTPLELFGDFFKIQNGRTMTGEQENFLSDIIKEVWEGEE